MTNKKLLVGIFLGLSIRLILAPFTGHPFDVSTWYHISNEILTNQDVISGQLSVAPAFYYTLALITHIYHPLSNALALNPTPLHSLPTSVQSAADWAIPNNPSETIVPDWLFLILLKIPFILADLATGILLYKIALPKYGNSTASLIFFLSFLNPMTIWVSGVWGMFDSLPAFFTLLSTYFVLKRKYYFSALALGVALAFKLYPVFIILPILLYIRRSHFVPIRKILKIALISIGTACLFFVSWASQFGSEFQAYLLQPGQYYGLTYWSVGPFLHFSGEVAILFQIVSLVGLTTCVYLLMYSKMKRGASQSDLFFWQLASISVIFFSYYEVNEQWFLWLLPFMILLSLNANNLTKISVVIISCVALVYSWVNSLLAAFFVPTAVYNSNIVPLIFSLTSQLIPFRLDLLAIFGSLFSILLLAFLVSNSRENVLWEKRNACVN